jgi:hypothetical protein
MAFIILVLFMELLLAIVLPGPNMGAPMRGLFGIRPGGNRISLERLESRLMCHEPKEFLPAP